MPYYKPLPVISPDTKPFWDAARRHELRLQRCRACGAMWFPPAAVCSNCLATGVEWVKVSGRGKVDSWVIFHQAFFPSFAEELPYNVAVIELEEGPHIVSNLVGVRNEDIRRGMPVEVVFEDVTPEVTLPKFRAVGGA